MSAGSGHDTRSAAGANGFDPDRYEADLERVARSFDEGRADLAEELLLEMESRYLGASVRCDRDRLGRILLSVTALLDRCEALRAKNANDLAALRSQSRFGERKGSGGGMWLAERA